jgi:5-(carboxyamino)imidazole ribonucleotide synthase
MLVLQDKLLQKQWLVRNGLPTLPFRAFAAEDDAERAGCFGYPLVQKARRGGYDGRGVQIIRSEQQRESLWPVASLIEPFMEGVRELAILAARSSSGEVVCFDPVELIFDGKRNVLDMVVAPAPITQRQAALARAIAHRTLNRLDSVGLFALELFLNRDGDLVINEISPRVHNSGHHTLESCETSQFEQHLRAVIGLPLGSTLQLQPCVMQNLLSSTENSQIRGSEAFKICNLQQHTFIHWYGKKTASPGRKMGHVTALGDTTDIARERAAAALHSASRLPAPAA